MDHEKYAAELFEKGYNCAQSVFAAFCDKTGLDFDTALKLSSSFGGGMGKLREVCGAVTGMFMVVGLLYGYTSPQDQEAKTAHYQLVQTMAEQFRRENGSIICRDLLSPEESGQGGYVPAQRTEAYYAARPCGALVAYAAKMLDEYIAQREEQNNT